MGKLSDKHVIIVHGWSDNWKSMKKVGSPLEAEGASVRYANYDSREDKAVYEDFAEGLDKELARFAKQGKLTGTDGRIHFVTHSTGALVLRQWFRQYPERHDRVGNVVFLAPANFGSPLATKGKSLIGKVFKGQHGSGDHFEVGQKILDGLELASPFAWKLSAFDLFGKKGSLYHKSGIRASVITGCKGYGGLRKFVNKPGTDGTIVVAGASLNSRRLDLDFVGPKDSNSSAWHGFTEKQYKKRGFIPVNMPFAIHNDLNHASILRLRENNLLRRQILDCLIVKESGYDRLASEFQKFTRKQIGKDNDLNYQQFVFRIRDDRGMPVPDYHLEFNVWELSRLSPADNGVQHVPAGTRMSREESRRSGELDRLLEENLHTHSQDSSYKRYLIRPDEVHEIVGDNHVLTMRIDAESGDRDITYQTGKLENIVLLHPERVKAERVKPFFTNTTTLIDIRIDRESRLLTIK